MNYIVISKYFGEYSNSIIIQGKKDGTKITYDIRVKFQEMNVEIESFGIKEAKQRNFKYPTYDDNYNYRKLNFEDRKIYQYEYIKKNLPSEVIKLALLEFIKSIQIKKY